MSETVALSSIGKFSTRPLGTGNWITNGQCSWYDREAGGVCGANVARNSYDREAVNADNRKGKLIAIKDGAIESSMWWCCDDHLPRALAHNAGSDVWEVDSNTRCKRIYPDAMFEVSFRWFTEDKSLTAAQLNARVNGALAQLSDGNESFEYVKTVQIR